MSEHESPELNLSMLPELRVPPMSEALRSAIDDIKPVATRRPMRELAIFAGLSLPFLLAIVLLSGIRHDINGLSPLWLGSVSLVWFSSFAASAYLGFVPARGHVAPRSRSILQIVLASSVVLISVGLFANEKAAGISRSYEASVGNVVAHAGACSLFGFSIGIVPGIVALLLMRRYVPVGRTSIGLSLGAAGGSLAGLGLLLHCSMAERFHVGLVHGAAIVISAIFVAGASHFLARR